MEHIPSFDRTIGGTAEDKEGVRQKAEASASRSGEDLFGDQLVTPEPHELVALQEGVAYANNVAASYGATRAVDATRVFLLKEGGVAATSPRLRNGVANTQAQSIAIDRGRPDALLSMSVAHETFHLASYQAEQILKDGGSTLYRSGLEMLGRDFDWAYFSDAQEAVIATLTRRYFDDVLAHDPRYREDVEHTEKIKAWLLSAIDRVYDNADDRERNRAGTEDILILSDGEWMLNVLNDASKNDWYKLGCFSGKYENELKSGTIFHERRKERDKFNATLERLVSSTNGALGTKEELFDAFARAHFTGNFLPLGRKIDTVLGKGAFRTLARELGRPLKRSDEMDQSKQSEVPSETANARV